MKQQTHYLRPVLKPKKWQRIVCVIWPIQQVKAYQCQTIIEQSFLQQTKFKITQLADQLTVSSFMQLKSYHEHLVKLIANNQSTPSSEEKSKQQWIHNQHKYNHWLKKHKLVNNAVKAKLNYKKSLSMLSKDINLASKAATKAYQQASWLSLYYFNHHLLIIWSQLYQWLDILSSTELLSRQTKRVTYYTYIAKWLATANNYMNIIYKLSNSNDYSHYQHFMQETNHIIHKCLNHDLSYLNVNKQKQQLLNELLNQTKK